MRTGIFGGSFNPIHNGHIALAKRLLESARLDEIWFVVSPQNPFKTSAGDLLDDDKRLDMVRIALEGEPRLVACDVEFRMPKPSYMWNTLQTLRRDFPERDFTLLIGADNWERFGEWRNADAIVADFHVAVYPRRGFSVNADTLPANVRLVDTPLYDVSSTEVRRLISEGSDVSSLIPSAIVPLAVEYYK